MGNKKSVDMLYKISVAYLRLVARERHIDGREHTADLAARHAQRHAHVGAQPHARALQRRVQCHVHRLAALARVVLVDHRRVVRHLVAGGPPTCHNVQSLIKSDVMCPNGPDFTDAQNIATVAEKRNIWKWTIVSSLAKSHTYLCLSSHLKCCLLHPLYKLKCNI